MTNLDEQGHHEDPKAMIERKGYLVGLIFYGVLWLVTKLIPLAVVIGLSIAVIRCAVQ